MGRLFWKFFLFIFLAQLTTTLGVGVSIWLRHGMTDEFDHESAHSPGMRVSAPIARAVSQLKDGGVDALKEYLRRAQTEFGLSIYALDATGNDLLGRSVPAGISSPQHDDHRPGSPRFGARVVSPQGEEYLLLQNENVPFDRHAGPPPRPGGIPGIPLMPIILGFIASLVFAGILAWYFSKPIRNLRNALQSAAEGRLDSRPGNEMGGRNDELADLARQFDQMAGRLHTLIQSQKRLLHDVSHEMRSPLARQQAAIDLARQQPDKTAYSMERLEKELSRMDTLVGELLALSRLEADMSPAMDDVVDVSELLTEICDDAGFEADPHNIIVALYDQADGDVKGNHELLRRAIENVVRNAVKHTPDKSTVVIRTSRQAEKQQIQIEVCDEGPGVPDEELDAIFEAFYRGRNHNGRDRENAGYGLGLAMAKRIIITHGGYITAFNRDTHGLCVLITLPLA